MTTPSPRCPACGSPEPAGRREVRSYSVLHCGTCGLWYVPPIAAQTGVEYDQLYADGGLYTEQRDPRRRGGDAPDTLPTLNRAARIAIGALERERPASLLEVGCGTGEF